MKHNYFLQEKQAQNKNPKKFLNFREQFKSSQVKASKNAPSKVDILKNQFEPKSAPSSSPQNPEWERRNENSLKDTQVSEP